MFITCALLEQINDDDDDDDDADICKKKLISLKHCVRSQITRLKLQKSFCDLEHGASL